MTTDTARIAGPITPFLWFDHEAGEAAELYVSIFPDSRITSVSRYGEAGQEVTGGAPGSVMTVQFELAGQPFTALNGGPIFRFTEAVSFVISCVTQDEVDYFWDRLSEGGDPAAQQCGWLKDRYGLSWQIVPTALAGLLGDPDPGRSARATEAMLKMKKLDISELERAAAG
jgi:predicted 3-demethylubiquinone-9 3-methyltransferase (glyoxalase superfamily)